MAAPELIGAAYELRHLADTLDPLPDGVRSAICVFCDTTFTGTMISEARANHAKECKAIPRIAQERSGPPTKDLALIIAARDLRRAGWLGVLVAATDGEHEYGHMDGDTKKIAASRIGEFERFVRKIYHRTALDSSPIVHREAAALLGLSPLPYPFVIAFDADNPEHVASLNEQMEIEAAWVRAATAEPEARGERQTDQIPNKQG